MLWCSINFLFPQRITFPSMTARIPSPAISFKVDGRVSSMPFSLAAVTILFAMGWVDTCSQLAARRRRVSSSVLPTVTVFCNTKFPSVMVPVLSITTALTSAIDSSATPPLKRMPFLEPAPIPEKNASGTLNTSAQGQLMTRKDRAV